MTIFTSNDVLIRSVIGGGGDPSDSVTNPEGGEFVTLEGISLHNLINNNNNKCQI